MFHLISFALIAVIVGYIFDFLPLAFITVAVFALIGLPIIGRWEARK